jgi:DNA polymerase/3'-5' exonuclease PolX
MNLNDAKQIAEEFAGLLGPVCERVEVAGSIRRGDKAEVKDAEIVIIPTRAYYALLESMLADGTIAKAIYDFRKGTTRWGEKYRGMVYRGLRIEVFCADAINWGYILWLRTGPGDGNTLAMQALNETNLRCIEGYVWFCHHWEREGEKWAARDEKQRVILREEADWFKALGLPYIAPNARAHVQWGLIRVRPDALELEAPVLRQTSLF